MIEGSGAAIREMVAGKAAQFKPKKTKVKKCKTKINKTNQIKIKLI
jgi:hypothetical protein